MAKQKQPKIKSNDLLLESIQILNENINFLINMMNQKDKEQSSIRIGSIEVSTTGSLKTCEASINRMLNIKENISNVLMRKTGIE